MVSLVKSVIHIFVIKVCFCRAFVEEQATFSILYNFVVDLKTNNDTLAEYLAKIQAVFCPEQPICNSNGDRKRSDLLKTLPEYLTKGNVTVKVENIPDIMGVCCFPCSCDKECEEDGNCCPSRETDNTTWTMERITSECIISLQKRNRQTGYDIKYARYYMITRCFGDSFDDTVVSKCENPDVDLEVNNVPVTSLKTNRTYWNKDCAVCNKDANDLVAWKPAIKFRADFVFYDNTASQASYLSTPEDWVAAIPKLGEIVYLPPIPMSHKRCSEFSINTCSKIVDTSEIQNKRFIEELCNTVNHPVNIHTFKVIPYFNIFCFFCSRSMIYTLRTRNCVWEDFQRDDVRQMTALLNYISNSGKEEKSLAETQASVPSCPCDQIYDSLQEQCRPIYCPVGEFLIGCSCVQLLKNLSGMPVLMKIWIQPEFPGEVPETYSDRRSTDSVFESMLTNTNNRDSQEQTMLTFTDKVKRLLQSKFNEITADTFAAFIQRNTEQPKMLFLVIIWSNWGHDTKESLKSFIDYHDNSKGLQFRLDNVLFSVKFTFKVSVQREGYTLIVVPIDKEFSSELKLIYQNNMLMPSSLNLRQYQEFSPLLYCKQVQLNDTEFTEKAGTVIINITSPILAITDFYRVSPNKVRICCDQYITYSTSKAILHRIIYTCLLVLSMTHFICM